MYLVSVIVPVYNAENFLDNTINSVINQTLGFENIELILVDDNSSDGSKDVIKKYSNQFENVIYYFSENNHGFPGFGRNMGLKLASADYVMFLDNDDEYDQDMCKMLYETMINENVDLVSCGRLLVDFLGDVKDNYNCVGGRRVNNSLIYENDEVLSFSSITVWNKIFKKSIIDDFNLKFIENTSADDFIFSVEYHSKSKRIIHLLDYYGYLWNIRDESLSHDIKIEHIEEVITAYKYLVNKLKEGSNIESSIVILRYMIILLLMKCSYVHVDYNRFKYILNEIYYFEKSIGMDFNLQNKFLDIPNNLILKQHFGLAILYFRLFDTIRNNTFLRKINRLRK